MKGVYERSKDFVGHLLGLAQPGREDRAALAALRSGLGQEPGASARMHKYVVPYLGERAHHSDRWFYAVGALFAWHPKPEPGRSLGAALRALVDRPEASDSLEARFTALLNSHPDDLPDHLRQAVGLLRSKDIGLDWFRLLNDLLAWDLPNHDVQRKWARDFYRATAGAPAAVAESDQTGEE
jgi:CRISPR system Cascade subunit CasB